MDDTHQSTATLWDAEQAAEAGFPIIHSVGTLARLFGVPTHRIVHVIRSRGIAHDGIAGNVRLYREAAAQRIGRELQRIAADKNGGRSRW